jgi:MSHA biogenesis protein MshQ
LIAGSSNQFVVRPFAFRLSGAGIPGVTGPAGPVFKRAGEDFPVTLTAVTWEAADDANADGVPDAGADLSGNATTLNFGQETSPAGATVIHVLLQPAGGSLGSLTGGAYTGFASGARTQNINWSEVGSISLSAALTGGDYLGSGQSVTGTVSPLGRFRPDNFTVALNGPTFTTACAGGGFTYVGQVFNYGTPPSITVTANKLGGGTTANYTGGFMNLTNATLTPGTQATRYSPGTLDLALLPLPTVDPAITDNADGTVKLAFSGGSGIAFQRATPVAPFNAAINLALNVIDSDGVAYATNPATFSSITFSPSAAMRFGRLRLQNALGSEKLALPIPIETQYWNGSAFIRNAQDSCTTLAKSNLALSGYAVNLAACETTVNQGTISFAAGLGTLTLSPAGAGNNGSVLLTANLGTSASGNFCPASPGAESPADFAIKAYLQGAWTGATWNENPSARATFGLFGGQPSNFIFFRENY